MIWEQDSKFVYKGMNVQKRGSQAKYFVISLTRVCKKQILESFCISLLQEKQPNQIGDISQSILTILIWSKNTNSTFVLLTPILFQTNYQFMYKPGLLALQQALKIMIASGGLVQNGNVSRQLNSEGFFLFFKKQTLKIVEMMSYCSYLFHMDFFWSWFISLIIMSTYIIIRCSGMPTQRHFCILISFLLGRLSQQNLLTYKTPLSNLR